MFAESRQQANEYCRHRGGQMSLSTQKTKACSGGGVEIEPDDVTQLLNEVLVVGQLEGTDQMR